MNVSEAIKVRRSIRKYKDVPVEPEKINEVLEAARLAPSARNRQEWMFYAVTDGKVKKAMCEGGASPFVAEAPVVLAVCAIGDRLMNCGHDVSSVDGSIAMSFAVLEATELGLGTCMIGSHDQKAVAKALGLSEEWKVPLLVTMGYPDETPEARPRKESAEVCKIL